MEPLIAFESAARHLSFTAAAAELNLSQAAVSQQIRNLEQALGVSLFIRSHRAITLSREGQVYRYTVLAALRQIAAATQELKLPAVGSRLTVGADQSIAAMWLIPRLPDFQRQFRDYTVRIVASDVEHDCLADDIDIAIIHGDGHWPAHSAEPLFAEQVIAVCSPGYLALHPELDSIESLTGQTLLNLENSHWNWMDWRTWLSLNDVHLPVRHQGLQVNSYPLLIDAARNGQGVALGWRYLIDQDLVDGTLVQPVDATASTDFGYYLVAADDNATHPGVIHFREWARNCIAPTG